MTEESLWDEIPSDFYVAIGRSGQEAIISDQCFLKGCDNQDPKKLHPFEKDYSKSKIQEDGSYFEYTKIKVKCDKCGGVFQFGLKIIYPPKKVVGKGAIMGMANALDENGEDIGFIGYF
ncbi:MAG: hypothetical protein ACTSRE_00520 [Promethearchaeota archaeon]